MSVTSLLRGSALAVALLVASCSDGGGSKPDAGDGGVAVAPRQIAPLSTEMVRDLRPTFRWTGEEGDAFTLDVSATVDSLDR